MKKLTLLLSILIVFVSCGKNEEVKFQAFSPEAFAYDIGDGWEVNATVNVKGFSKTGSENKTYISLSYSVDLVNPDSSVTKNVFSDNKEIKEKEINEVQLEAQFDLNSTYPLGEYKIIFNITDNNSKKQTNAQADFKLEE